MNSRSHPVSQTSLFITSSLVVFIVTMEFFPLLGEEVRLPSPNTTSGQSSILAASLPGAPLSSFFRSAGSVAELLTPFRSCYCSSVRQLLTCFSWASALFCLLIQFVSLLMCSELQVTPLPYSASHCTQDQYSLYHTEPVRNTSLSSD